MANQLCEALETAGNQCFIAPRDIRSGYVYAEELTNGIDNSDVVLLVLTKAANNSPHVLREIERAVTKNIPIIVYKVEEVELTKSMEYFLMTHQWMEASNNSVEDVVKCIEDFDPAVMAKASKVNAGESKAIEPKTVEPKMGKVVGVAAIVIGVVAVLLGASLLGRDTEDAQTDAVEYLAEDGLTDLENLKPGDTFTMGVYNDEDIYWRVLKVSEEGTEAVVVSRDVITVKAFDGAESGHFNHDGTENYNFDTGKAEGDFELQAYIRGNSNWSTSNIRTWLNADTENVVYEGQAPTSKAMADGTNGYNQEKGFLCSFTEEELARIKTTTVETKGNILSDTDTIVTQDKVFLLSMDELAWFQEADVSLMAKPTVGAIANDKNSWYNTYCVDYGVENTMWWLREPVEDSSCQCYLVGNGYNDENIYTWEVGVEGFGIRPAMTIKQGR